MVYSASGIKALDALDDPRYFLVQQAAWAAIGLVAMGLAMYFVAGARVAEFAALGGLATVSVAAVAVVQPYRLARLATFLDPWRDPQGAGFQTIQSIFGLALGGPFGEGLGAGKEKFGFLPAPYTDSIFAVLGDELGLLGTLTVVVLFLVIAFKGNRIALAAPDAAEALAALTTVELRFIGGRRGLEGDLARTAGLPFHATPLPSLRDPDSKLAFLLHLSLLPVAAVDALVQLIRDRPDVVLTSGSFSSLPVLFAARVLRVPIYLWVGDAIPGRALSAVAGWSSGIGLTFEAAMRSMPRGRASVTGNPVRGS